MVLSKVLFASRSRRAIPPLLCLVLAVVAGITGQSIGVVVGVGFLLLAIQFKIGAELSGQLARLASAHRAARRAARHALNSATASTRAVASRAQDTEQRLDLLATELQRARSSAADDIGRLQEGQEKLRDEVGRLIASLQPIRRHRPFDGETLPDLSLSSSMEMLAHRFEKR